MSAPRVSTNGGPDPTLAEADSGAKWRLPLDPIQGSIATTPLAPIAVATPPEPIVAPIVVVEAEQTRPQTPEPLEASNGAPATEVAPRQFEAPDVTARYVVAQLGELNERISALTEQATEKTDAALEKVHSELRRITSMREVDLTEQAAGIFGAVQSGADALGSFATVVGEVTADLRLILTESLEAIGGTEGLAVRVAQSATELTEVRTELTTSIRRIERDLAAMRKQARVPVESMGMNLNDDQLTFIVEAVTEAVVAALGVTPARVSRRR